MKYTKLTVMILGLLLSCFTGVVAAKAEGSRSYITPSGSDNRPCSRSQPCRTFDGALAKTDEGGEIVALDTATYDPTTIMKSITLTAAPGADVVIKASSGNAVTINSLSGATVVLRGLKLSGPGKTTNTTGVSLHSGLSDSVIYVENCLISDFGTGINALIALSARLVVSDSVIRNNQTGLAASFNGTETMGASATRTRFERNGVGVKALGGRAVVLKECVASGNNTGFQAEGTGRLVISNSLATRNSTGIEVKGFGRAILAFSTISGNNTGIESEGVVQSMGNNWIVENEMDLSGPPVVITPGS